MTLIDTFRIVVLALRRNQIRSLLTSLGIVVGIATVIATTSAGKAAENELDSFLRDLGKNVILIRPGAADQDVFVSYGAPLTREDLSAIRESAGADLAGVAPSQAWYGQLASGSRHWSTLLTGTTPELQTIRGWVVTEGRYFTSSEVQQEAAVCVLADRVRAELFPPEVNPIGQFIRVNGLQMRVIGTLRPKGKVPAGFDQDDQVFLPITTLQRKLAGNTDLTLIVAAARSVDRIEAASQAIRKALRSQRRVKPSEPDSFTISTIQEMSALAVTITGTMQLLVALLAGIALFIGGLGIMNVMLAAVVEQTREIGVRMALGATGGQVLAQFLLQGAVLSLGGGVGGVIVGLGIAAIMARLAGWPLVIAPNIILLALGMATFVGLVFSWFPARRAARLPPIEALRHD